MLCEKCGNPSLKHTACAVCGTYKGKVVIDVITRANKKAAKAKAEVR